jgi:hypothetical protein
MTSSIIVYSICSKKTSCPTEQSQNQDYKKKEKTAWSKVSLIKRSNLQNPFLLLFKLSSIKKVSFRKNPLSSLRIYLFIISLRWYSQKARERNSKMHFCLHEVRCPLTLTWYNYNMILLPVWKFCFSIRLFSHTFISHLSSFTVKSSSKWQWFVSKYLCVKFQTFRCIHIILELNITLQSRAAWTTKSGKLWEYSFMYHISGFHCQNCYIWSTTIAADFLDLFSFISFFVVGFISFTYGRGPFLLC